MMGDLARKELERLLDRIDKLEAAQQKRAADGATPRAYCKVHETYYDVSMGCAACPPRR